MIFICNYLTSSYYCIRCMYKEIHDCPICIHNVTNNILNTECNHIYHKSCLLDYITYNIFKSNNDIQCPMCKAHIIIPNIITINDIIMHYDIETSDNTLDQMLLNNKIKNLEKLKLILFHFKNLGYIPVWSYYKELFKILAKLKWYTI